jgi:hypothetical protein
LDLKKEMINMSNIWDGTYLFLWQANKVDGGNINSMISQAKQLGITGVLIKFANGSLANDPVSQGYMTQFKNLIGPFKAAGLKVGGWIYQYLTDVQGEVDACFQAIDAGADWIVLDGEAELKGKNSQVAQFGQLLRSKYPNFPIGLSSFALADYHPEVPFTEYINFVNVMMPQIYWGDLSWDVTVAFYASMGSYQKYGKPIIPTGQAYDKVTPADMAQFIQLCKSTDLTGISWWDWQDASTDQLTAIQSNLILPGSSPISMITQESAQKVIDVLGALYNASSDSEVQEASHFAANALRKVVGIPTS